MYDIENAKRLAYATGWLADVWWWIMLTRAAFK